jgi:hypothetical protein
MPPRTRHEDRLARFEAVKRLVPLGFRLIEGWEFEKNGVTYDLSAADLNMIDHIEANGLFVTSRCAT